MFGWEPGLGGSGFQGLESLKVSVVGFVVSLQAPQGSAQLVIGASQAYAAVFIVRLRDLCFIQVDGFVVGRDGGLELAQALAYIADPLIGLGRLFAEPGIVAAFTGELLVEPQQFFQQRHDVRRQDRLRRQIHARVRGAIGGNYRSDHDSIGGKANVDSV